MREQEVSDRMGEVLKDIYVPETVAETIVAALSSDSETYENSKGDWDDLNTAARQARHLEMVGADQFVDRKNPEAVTPTWFTYPVADLPGVVTPEAPVCVMPQIHLMPGQMDFLACPGVDGYDADEHLDRAVYVSVWVEKSTQNDILGPLCEELGLELVTFSGRSSITAAIQFLLRLKKVKKPGRIFYISDFDPAGKNMPVEASRHIEYYLPLIAPEAEVALHVLALTKKQVEHYNLPRNVLKDKDLSKAKFEAQHGKGGCELDALEGIHPGELERLIRNAVKQYDDDSLPDRLEEARSLAEENVLGAWAVDTKKLREEFGIVRDEIQKRARKYSARVQALQKQMAQELRPYQKRLRKLEQEFADVIENFDVEVEDRPAPEIEPDEKDWLFDSRRDYLTQLGFYQRHKTGSDGPLEGTGHRLAVPTREKNGADQ